MKYGPPGVSIHCDTAKALQQIKRLKSPVVGGQDGEGVVSGLEVRDAAAP